MVPVNWAGPSLGYLLAFGAATAACAAGANRARKIEHDGTRRGLVGLLVTAGGWAAFELGLLVTPDRAVAYGLYELSLIVGLATVGAWLYFCSAYTGRSFHRNAVYRRVAAVTYLVIVGVKLTNPVHGLYFTGELTATPFVHLAIEHGLLHWIVSGLAYALASVGLFMLYEMFLEANYDTTPLALLAGATALPVAFDIVGFATPTLLDVNYEPLGVAVFAVGALYVFKDRFFAVQLAEDVDDPVVHTGPDGEIRESNERAREQFPALADATGEPFADVFPAAAERLDSGDRILEWNDGGETRYYLVSDVSATLGQTDIVRSVVFSDVTETETRRRELERQNEELEGFAAAIRHNLLNTLQVIEGRLDSADRALESGSVRAANESLAKASDVTYRMEETVGDLATLARAARTVEQTRSVPFDEVVRDAFAEAATDGIDLSVDPGGRIRADESRLRELLKNGVRFAVHNGATTVTATLNDDGFEITDDGAPPAETDVEKFFQYGRALPDSETGMKLANMRMLARVHGWEVTVDTDYRDGFRFVVSGAATDRTPATAGDRAETEAADSTVS